MTSPTSSSRRSESPGRSRKPPAEIVILPDGTVSCVYADLDLQALGHMAVCRASNVEFDNAAQEWVAIGTWNESQAPREIARGPVREEVIAEEIRYLNKHGSRLF